MLFRSEMIEVKTGPYSAAADKRRFQPVLPATLKFAPMASEARPKVSAK